MDTLLHDLRYSLRRLGQAPGFTLAAVVTLAIGIGATTAIFSVVNGVLLRALPYPDPSRLVAFQPNTSAMDLKDILEWSRSFSAGGGYVPQALDLIGGDEPVQVQAALVTGDVFGALGVKAERGRTLDANDDRAGGARSVVVSHAFWKGRLGGDASAIGRALTLSGDTYTIVGIMPKGFELPRVDVELFAPLAVVFPEGATHRGVHFLRTCLRLSPGTTLAQATNEMTLIAQRLEQVDPEENKGRQWPLVPLLERMVANVRTALWILLGAVSLALLVACTNFANLLLARSAVRSHEFAIRTSLGAGRRHLVRQLLTESTLLALAGGGLGVLLAVWGVDLLLALRPDSLPRLSSIGVDLNVLAFAGALSLITGLAFGLIPALHQSGRHVNDALKQGSATSVSKRGALRLLGSLVASQVALALMLLIGAGLLVNGFVRLLAVEPGFDPRHTMTLRIELPQARYMESNAQHQYQDRLLEAFQRLPGAETALVSELPLSGNALNHNFVIDGRPPIPVGEEPELFSRSVAGDYFHLMRIPIRSGRALAPTDGAGAPLVGVINESMARQYFERQNPIGQRIRWARSEGPPQWITIVGVAGDIRHFGLDAQEYPAIYTPYAQLDQDWKRWMHLVVRSPEPEGPLTRRIKTLAWSVDPAIPLTEVRPLGQVVASSMAERRFNVLMIGLFAGVALLLAAIGIYGVTSYAVSRRTRELGVRMALGASKRDVALLVLQGGMRFIGIGIVIGIAGALGLSRLMTSLLYQVRATDPATYVAVAAGLALVGLAACAIPALKAGRLDPNEALRCE